MSPSAGVAAGAPGPGRAVNPFCVQRVEPGALAFVGRGEACVDAILVRFIALGMRGQITGAHGTGKTTLLVSLAGRARALGWGVELCRAGRDVVRAPGRPARAGLPRVLFVDSADQMGAWKWSLVRRAMAARGVGLVVTTHRDLGLPALHRREVDAALATELVAKVGGGWEGLDAAEVGAVLAARGGSMREVFFDMYDRCERGPRESADDGPGGAPVRSGSAD